MLLSVLLSMFLAEDQLQKVIIHHLLTKESIYFGTSLGLCDIRTVEFCSKPFFKSNIGYVIICVPLNSWQKQWETERQLSDN